MGRLPLPRRKEDEVELDVFIVEGMTEDSGDNDDAFVVVAAPTNPAEEEDDLVVIVGAPDSSRQPKQFESLRRPYQVDCNSPLDRGICQRRSLDQTDVEAFYYDPGDNKCVQFLFSGCGGNTNRFSNREDCELQCVVKEESQPRSFGEDELEALDIDPSVCSAPGGKPGICKGAFQYFYFNQETGECEPFVFGGCEAGSSLNKFSTIDSCQRTCSNGRAGQVVTLY